jgi:hypothetical protein
MTLQIAPLVDTATVTASRGQVEIVGMTGQPVNVISEEEIDNRAKVVVAQAVEGEAGVALQRTSPSMAGVSTPSRIWSKPAISIPSRSCADHRAISTAATPSGERFNSCPRSRLSPWRPARGSAVTWMYRRGRRIETVAAMRSCLSTDLASVSSALSQDGR